jgi:cytochrome c556
MLRVLAGVAALAVGATLVLAQNTGAITQRKAAMKAIAGGAKVAGDMARGEFEKDEGGQKVKVKVDFDLAKVQAALKTIETEATKAKGLFPDDSKVGDTKASPKVFTDRAGFMKAMDQLVADARAAQTAVKNKDSLAAEWKKVAANCGGCHKEYREK